MKTGLIRIFILSLCILFLLNGCSAPEENRPAYSDTETAPATKPAAEKGERLPFPSVHRENIRELSEDQVKGSTQRESTYHPGAAGTYGDLFTESSGIYRKLNKGEDVNILINGDSIGAGGGSTDGHSWTDLLKSYIESEYSVSCNITNISLGGNGSYAGYVQENILNDGTDYDLMIICYGENDDRKSLPSEYEALIRSAEEKYPSCNIISVLESSQREYTGKIETIEGLSEYYDIPTADTIAAFEESGKAYEELTVDVKHPNDEGYRLYFEAVKEIIDRETENDTGVERIERAPLDPQVNIYDNFRYFPVEKFVRTGETTYVLNLSEKISGVIGLYHLFSPSNGDIIIKTDGVESVRRHMEWSYDFKQDYIYRPDNEIRSAKSSIEISFPTVEMADGFRGMIFTSP